MDVEQDDLARRVFLEVAIGGHDAMSFLEPYLTSFEFSDQAEGKSDEISIELHDRDGKWIEEWMPSEGTAYSACTVEYHDPATNELRTYTYNPVGGGMTAGNTAKVFPLDGRVESEADAMAVARNRLRGANKGEVTGSFTVFGNPGLVAGMTVEMEGLGKFSGKYFVTKTTHSGGGKYTTKAEIRKVLGY
jgi:phage protein D